MDRSTRNLSIITLLVLAIFLALNHIARRAGLADWGLVLLFLLLTLAIWFYDRVSRRGIDDDEAVDTLIEPLTYEHPAGTISIPDSIQVAGPDLTRSPAPIPEAPPVSPPSAQPEAKSEPVESQPSAPTAEQNPPAAASTETTIEEKSAPPSSAAGPETHPDLAAKAPERANLPSVPVDDKPAGEPVPSPIPGSAPEPIAPRSSTEPVPNIPAKEMPQQSAVEAPQASTPITSSAAPVADDIKVSASEAAAATPAAPDPNLPINAVTTQPDDLKIIEGIGPKMEKALQAAGINTFAMLAGASESQIRDAITAAGMRFAPSVPTWAEQASYAANGDFVGLEAYQKTLVSGRKSK